MSSSQPSLCAYSWTTANCYRKDRRHGLRYSENALPEKDISRTWDLSWVQQ